MNSSYSCYTIDLVRTTGTRACVLNNPRIRRSQPVNQIGSDRDICPPFFSRAEEEHRADRTALGTLPVVLGDPASFFNPSPPVVITRCTRRRSPRTSRRSSPPRRYGACNPVLANPLANSVRETSFPIENLKGPRKLTSIVNVARVWVRVCMCVCVAQVSALIRRRRIARTVCRRVCMCACTSAVCSRCKYARVYEYVCVCVCALAGGMCVGGA